MFLIAPFSWDHHLVLILPAIFIAIYEAWNRKLYIALPVLLGTAFFLALNFNFNNPSFREGWRTLLISAKLYAVAIIWLFFVLASLMGLKGLKSEHQSKKWKTFHGNLR
jgi:Na+/glutamate symporter